MDYIIQPVLMKGLINNVSHGMVMVHLQGRLGVITIPERLVRVKEKKMMKPGEQVKFYFSYMQVVENPYDYDSAAMDSDTIMYPAFLGGKLIEVNDTAVKAEIMGGLGFVSVPRRWVFTDVGLKTGLWVEFYLSFMEIVK